MAVKTTNEPIPDDKVPQFLEIAAKYAHGTRVHKSLYVGEDNVSRVDYTIDDMDDYKKFGDGMKRVTTPIVEVERTPIQRWWRKKKRQFF